MLPSVSQWGRAARYFMEKIPVSIEPGMCSGAVGCECGVDESVRCVK